MVREIRRNVLGLALALAAWPLAAAQAQEHQRFSVLIPDMRPEGGSNRKFGENVAKELRSLLDNMATHQSVSKRDMEQGMKAFKIDSDDFDCGKARQLASQKEWPLALCATYTEVPEGWAVTAEFFDVRSGESFQVSPVTVAKAGEADAARHIFGEFDRYTEQLRAAAICLDYVASKVWDQGLITCERSIELNPNAISSRYFRARILYETERLEESLGELERVLGLNAIHEDALQLAGYIAAKLGRDDEALAFYTRYLELSPGNAPVRMKIAYELAQAGDPHGAMVLIQEGLDQDRANIDLWEQLGGFAFAAGQRLNAQARPESQDATTLVPEAAELYRIAIEAYLKVFEARGAETSSNQLRSIVAAYVALGEMDNALSMADRALKTHPQEAELWSVYADALQRADRLSEALTALDRVTELNPSYPTAGLRRGKWLLEAGRVPEGAAALRTLASADPAQADAAGRLVIAHAYSKGVQPKNWGLAISTLDAGRGIPGMGAETGQQINFWLGYSILQSAIPEQEARTVETAQATLPKFQRARDLFQQSGDYPRKVNVNMEQLMTAVGQYIEIQESIIKRGR